MKRFNAYYVISTISLAFMMLIFIRTLEVRGWFQEHRMKTPAELLVRSVRGQYELSQENNFRGLVEVSLALENEGDGWLMISRDSIPFLLARLSDFEDEQVLVELFQLDSAGEKQRLEGCELLVSEISGHKTGSTLGEFCGLKQDSQVYIDLQIHFEESRISLQMDSKYFNDQTLIRREDYLLERREIHDE